MMASDAIAVSLWEVQGQPVFGLRASQMTGKGHDRQHSIGRLLRSSLGQLTRFAFVLEDLDPPDAQGRPGYSLAYLDATRDQIDFSARAARHASASLAFSAAVSAEYSLVAGQPTSEVRLLTTQDVFRVERAAIGVRTTRMAARSSGASTKLLPTGQAIHRLSSGIDVSIVDAGQAVLLVRADALGSTGREASGKRFKTRLTALQWDELYDEVSGLLDPNDTEEIRLLGLERARELPLVWIAPGGKDQSTMDCSLRCSSDGKMVEPCSGAVQLSLAVAAAIPGTVLQEITRTLPGLDCRVGLGERVMVASADVRAPESGASARSWRLSSITLQQSLQCLLRGHCPV